MTGSLHVGFAEKPVSSLLSRVWRGRTLIGNTFGRIESKVCMGNKIDGRCFTGHELMDEMITHFWQSEFSEVMMRYGNNYRFFGFGLPKRIHTTTWNLVKSHSASVNRKPKSFFSFFHYNSVQIFLLILHGQSIMVVYIQLRQNLSHFSNIPCHTLG